MKYTIYVVSPPSYPHSPGAFMEVADALKEAFQTLGHECAVVTIQPAAHENVIILGANLLTHYPSAHWIIYNLEQVTQGSPWITNWYISLLKLHPVWDYSPANIKELGKIGISATFLPIGYSPCLTKITDLTHESWFNDHPLDILFYGSMNERRQKIFDQIKHSCNAHWVFGVYGNKRDALIAHAKVVVNVHFYESKVFEIVRCSYLLANSKCIVSETGTGGDEFVDCIAFADYGDIAGMCLDLVKDADRRAILAKQGFETFGKMSQADYLKTVL